MKGYHRSVSEYDIEYADTFWDVCSACLCERSKNFTTGSEVSPNDIISEIQRYYEEFGSWPNPHQLKTARGYPDKNTVFKNFSSFDEAVDKAKSSAT